jgi:hypothetical protein
MKRISSQSREEGHEVSDAKPKWVAMSVAGFFFTIVFVMVILHWMKASLPNEPRNPVMTRFDDSFRHAPFAESGIARDWARMNRDTYAHLHTYRWIDRRNGVAAIPIERAMRLVATEGLPSRIGSPPAFPLPTQEMLPLRQSEQIHDLTKSY